MFDRYISINDRKLSIPNEYLINRFASIVWKKSIVRQISITKNCNGCSSKGLPAIEGRRDQIRRKFLYSRFVFSEKKLIENVLSHIVID